jgi:hypothetical protein
MTKDDDRADRGGDHKDRAAAALRENLRRRKDQQRKSRRPREEEATPEADASVRGDGV